MKHRSFPLRADSVLCYKTVWRKIVILAPPLIPTIFRYQKYCRTQKGSSTIFLGTVRENVLTEKRDNPFLPPSPPPSLLCISFFDNRIFVDHGRAPLRSFWYCEATNVRQRNVIIPPSLPPSLLSLIFFDTRIFVDHRRVPLRSLSVLWDSQLSMENRDITFSSKNFSIPELNYILMGSPTKYFVTVRQQIFCRKSLYSLLRHKFFRYPKLSETQKDSSTRWFRTVKPNNLTENRDTRAPH